MFPSSLIDRLHILSHETADVVQTFSVLPMDVGIGMYLSS
jgi:hypothetical protein